MSHGRRTNDRRRRVLYSAHQADNSPATSRGEAERLREARCPPSAYGSRVHRRLRARWFSLVPVRRRTLIAVAGMITAVAALLAGAHYASVAWPSIAYESEIARPLRLDRPDSFGRWFMVALLAGSSGTSFLIYQLRRYRNDDFKGHYRLWRLVLIVMMLASLNSLVSIIDWGGAILDVGFGKRVALAGSDWIRLVVSFGGAVLALRLVAEVRRCRFALATMLVACVFFAIPEAAKWNVLQVDSLGKWAAVTSAPLLACTALFISLGGYLRMLYREVRQIEGNDSLRDRFQQMRLRVFRRSEREEEESEEGEPRRRRPQPRRQAVAKEEHEEEAVENEVGKDDASDTPRAKRRWFGLRRAKTEQVTGEEEEETEEAESEAEPAKPRKRRRFSMRLSPPASEETDQTSDEIDNSEETDESGDESKRRTGGWFRRKRKSEPDSSDQDQSQQSAGERSKSAAETADDDEMNPDEIDWNSLSKSERRRLRKQLKRQNRAA